MTADPTILRELPHPPTPDFSGSSGFQWSQHPLELLPQLQARYGDLVSFGEGSGSYLVSDPALIEFIHVQTGRLFDKGYLQGGGGMGMVFGNGLVVSEGDFWLRQRRMIQPAFHRERVLGYGQVILGQARQLAATWQGGQTRDLHADMMHVTLGIILKSLFDLEAGPEAEAFGEAMESMLRATAEFNRAAPVALPDLEARFGSAVARIDAFTAGVIEARRREPSGQERDRGDLLSTLLAVQDDEQRGMNDRQLLDECKNLIMAGHETTSNTLSWTFWLLDSHPEAEARLHAELDAVLAGREPEVSDLDRLPYTRQVILEAIRVMPPVWSVSRQARQDMDLGGHFIPQGAVLNMSQWVVQRDARWFPEPLAFRPERWVNGFERTLPRYAYFPFGGGPRVCIGENFARMEAVLLLASFARRFRFHLAEGERVEPEPGITLRPQGGLRMVLEAR